MAKYAYVFDNGNYQLIVEAATFGVAAKEATNNPDFEDMSKLLIHNERGETFYLGQDWPPSDPEMELDELDWYERGGVEFMKITGRAFDREEFLDKLRRNAIVSVLCSDEAIVVHHYFHNGNFFYVLNTSFSVEHLYTAPIVEAHAVVESIEHYLSQL